MNSRIPLNRIAELTAVSTGSDLAVSLQFIKDLFSLVEEEVSLGNEVEISGLGTFVKSGEIDEPISFIPDEDFAGRLNEAFSMFSPVELHDEVTENELAEADITDERQPEMEVEISETSETSEAANAPEIAESPEVPPTDESLRQEEINQPEAVEMEETAFQDNISEDVDSVAIEETQEENSDKADIVQESENVSESDDKEIPIIEVSDLETEISAEEIALPDVGTGNIAETAVESEIPEEEMEYVVVRKSGSRFWIGMLLGFLLGFAAGVIAFLAYLVNILNIQVENVFPF